MPVPTHREDCETQIWRTRCPDCGEIVYFFSCTCGSKVFFDLNQPPWNPHEDRCIPYLIRYLREVKQLSPTHIREMIEQYSRSRDIPIPPDINKQIIALENKYRGKVIVLDILPGDEDFFVIGQIMSVNLQVNFFKRLNYLDNRMGRAFLGKLVAESYVEILIREDPDEETCFSSQFRFFIPLMAFEQSRLRENSRAAVTLLPYLARWSTDLACRRNSPARLILQKTG